MRDSNLPPHDGSSPPPPVEMLGEYNQNRWAVSASIVFVPVSDGPPPVTGPPVSLLHAPGNLSLFWTCLISLSSRASPAVCPGSLHPRGVSPPAVPLSFSPVILRSCWR